MKSLEGMRIVGVRTRDNKEFDLASLDVEFDELPNGEHCIVASAAASDSKLIATVPQPSYVFPLRAVDRLAFLREADVESFRKAMEGFTERSRIVSGSEN